MKIKETKDHYVARAYLKRFQNSKNKLYVCKKGDEKYSSSTPKAICFERGWDLMKGSDNKLWLKKILEDIEPKLSSAMTRLVHTKSTLDDRFIISTYLAILQTLNPDYLKKVNSDIERIILQFFQQHIYNGRIKIPEELLAKNITVEDLAINVNSDITRILLANLLDTITASIYTSSWAIIKNNTKIDFFTSDNPFYFLALPLEKYKFPKYIALDPENLLFIFPSDEVNMHKNNGQKIDFTNIHRGADIYLEAKDENEIALFNIYTIGNTNRFIIMRRACAKLKKLISNNINTSTKFLTQTLGSTSNYLRFETIHCNRNTVQQEADMKIFTQLFNKSRLIKNL